jgi:mono/diheme cytochrome c family protein
MKRALALLALAAAAMAADPAMIEKGRAEEKRACAGCHGLRIIHIQRLSRATWDRELTKMAGWGTDIREREALLEYLVANFGDDKPLAPLEVSQDGVRK